MCEHIPPQLQDLVVFLAEIPSIALYPFLLPVGILLSAAQPSGSSLTPPTHPWLYIICNPQKSGLCLIFQVISEDLNSTVAPIGTWGTALPSSWTLCCLPQPSLPPHGPVFNPPHCTYITHTSSACLGRCYSSVKSLPDEDEVINTHCSPLSHQAGLFIIEGNQVG